MTEMMLPSCSHERYGPVSSGMTNTRFYNGTGAVFGAFEGYYAPAGSDPSASNEVTAKDMSILAYHLIKKHPDVLEFTNDTQVTVKAGTPLEETLDAYNHSLPGARHAYEGVDGLKTGSSPQAGYNSIVTAKRGDTRLIVVVLGASAWGRSRGRICSPLLCQYPLGLWLYPLSATSGCPCRNAGN